MRFVLFLVLSEIVKGSTFDRIDYGVSEFVLSVLRWWWLYSVVLIVRFVFLVVLEY